MGVETLGASRCLLSEWDNLSLTDSRQKRDQIGSNIFKNYKTKHLKGLTTKLSS